MCHGGRRSDTSRCKQLLQAVGTRVSTLNSEYIFAEKIGEFYVDCYNLLFRQWITIVVHWINIHSDNVECWIPTGIF